MFVWAETKSTCSPKRMKEIERAGFNAGARGASYGLNHLRLRFAKAEIVAGLKGSGTSGSESASNVAHGKTRLQILRDGSCRFLQE